MVLYKHIWEWYNLQGEKFYYKLFFFNWKLLYNNVYHLDYHIKQGGHFWVDWKSSRFTKVVEDTYLVLKCRDEARGVGFVRWDANKVWFSRVEGYTGCL